MQKCKYFSLAFGSSTDISATSQCSVFVRYQTRGTDNLNTISTFLENNDIDIKKLVCVCTGGCPSMIGFEKGVVTLLKKKYNLTNLLSFQCIIHQENLVDAVVCYL